MNAHKQRIFNHLIRMDANFRFKDIEDPVEREKLIKEELKRVFKSEKYSGPDTQRSG